MKHVHLDEAESRLQFVKRAAEDFEKNPIHSTFGDIMPGRYFAVRWGMDNDCILVFKIDEEFEPEIYNQSIDRDSSIKYTEAFKAFAKQFEKP